MKLSLEILKLLQAIIELKEVAIMHCPSHQKLDNLIFQGNNREEQMSKLATKTKKKKTASLMAV